MVLFMDGNKDFTLRWTEVQDVGHPLSPAGRTVRCLASVAFYNSNSGLPRAIYRFMENGITHLSASCLASEPLIVELIARNARNKEMA